jgi:cobalt-zinc-cadmium resistance protein CzcA
LQQNLRNLVEGETLGLVLEGVIRTPLIIKGSAQSSGQVESFKNLMITAPDGRVWPLSALAEIQQGDGPIRVDHEQSSRFASIQVSVEGRALTSFVEEAKLAVAQLNLPKELKVVWGGQFENQQRASARLALVIPVALFMIFAILTVTFGSVVQASIIFMNIPFALVGGVMSLAISGQYLSVPASVGFIALLGIAVLNGVVMVSHFNERLMAGEDIESVIKNGSERRLRPVLMTAIITALGMIPLLLATGPGSEIQRPLAIVVIGGLLTSTLLTLLLLPKIYERFGTYASLQQVIAEFNWGGYTSWFRKIKK